MLHVFLYGYIFVNRARVFLYYLHAKLQNIYTLVFQYKCIVKEKMMQTCAYLFFEGSFIIFAIAIKGLAGYAGPMYVERKNACYEKNSVSRLACRMCTCRL